MRRGMIARFTALSGPVGQAQLAPFHEVCGSCARALAAHPPVVPRCLLVGKAHISLPGPGPRPPLHQAECLSDTHTRLIRGTSPEAPRKENKTPPNKEKRAGGDPTNTPVSRSTLLRDNPIAFPSFLGAPIMETKSPLCCISVARERAREIIATKTPVIMLAVPWSL